MEIDKVLTKKFLNKEYVVKKRNVLDISKEIGISHSVIYRKLKVYKIPLRVIIYRKIVKCSYCNKEFEKIKSLIKKNNFCNMECRGKYHSLHIKGKNNPNYGNYWTEEMKQIARRKLNKGKKIKYNCKFCYKIFYSHKQRYDKERKYCSRECYVKDRNEKTKIKYEKLLIEITKKYKYNTKDIKKITKKYKNYCSLLNLLNKKYRKTKKIKEYIWENKENIVEEYINGKNSNDLAKKYNCSNTLILNIIRKKDKNIIKNKLLEKMNRTGIKIMFKTPPKLFRGFGKKPILCECGCGRMTSGKWNPHTKDYAKYIVGHIAIKNMRKDFDEHKDEIIKMYNQLNNHLIIADKFKVSSTVVLNRLRKWGVKIRKRKWNNGKLLSEDNHYLHSTGELFIDNWLFFHEIFHIPHKRIGFGRYQCDFYLPIGEKGIYIEYWGLNGNKIYDKDMEKKKEIYQRLGLNLISIYPSDNIQEKLRPLLKYSKVQKQIIDFETEGGTIQIIKDE